MILRTNQLYDTKESQTIFCTDVKLRGMHRPPLLCLCILDKKGFTSLCPQTGKKRPYTFYDGRYRTNTFKNRFFYAVLNPSLESNNVVGNFLYCPDRSLHYLDLLIDIFRHTANSICNDIKIIQYGDRSSAEFFEIGLDDVENITNPDNYCYEVDADDSECKKRKDLHNNENIFHEMALSLGQ